MSAPPPPPPHGEMPRSGGLPPGKYDIFVIPEHSAGSGFLYLPSLQPNINSFVAGFASALILVALCQSMAPAFRAWWDSFQGLGNMGVALLIIGVGFGAWVLGRTQTDSTSSSSRSKSKPSAPPPGPQSGPPPGPPPHTSSSGPPPGAGPNPGPGGYTHPPPQNESSSSSSAPPPPPNGGTSKPQSSWQQRPQPPPTPNSGTEKPQPSWQGPPPPPPFSNGTEKPQSSWQRPPPPPPSGGSEKTQSSWQGPSPTSPPSSGAEKPQSSWQRPAPQPGNKRTENPKPSAKGSWEKARDEMRKKEEERKAKESEQKRREELAKRLAELRAKEAKERLEREKEKQRKEKEVAEKKEKDAKAAAEKAKAAAAAAAAANPPPSPPPSSTQSPLPTNRVRSSYAFSGVGEKMSMWPNGKPPAPSSPTPKVSPSVPKKPPAPSARTYVSTEGDGYSFRPYDKPKRPQRRNSGGSYASDTSWTPSHTTARTSPPPSVRGPYTTKDPDKIVIQAVYLFMNQFAKTPASQLISGAGSVTDGLILRITTEGLFIDDDVRGVPQREWDVKAWTLKLIEVWCPLHCLNNSASAWSSNPNVKNANLLHKMATGRTRHADRDPNKPLVGEEADAYLTDMLKVCRDCCRLGFCEQKFGKANTVSSNGQSGDWKAGGLHLLRATVRDNDGKRYLFVIDETEHWKVGASIQRLRRGAQARSLGVCSMTASEAKNTLETLGWVA